MEKPITSSKKETFPEHFTHETLYSLKGRDQYISNCRQQPASGLKNHHDSDTTYNFKCLHLFLEPKSS